MFEYFPVRVSVHHFCASRVLGLKEGAVVVLSQSPMHWNYRTELPHLAGVTLRGSGTVRSVSSACSQELPRVKRVPFSQTRRFIGTVGFWASVDNPEGLPAFCNCGGGLF